MIREYLNKQGTTKIIDAIRNNEDNINLLDGRVTAIENSEVDIDHAKSVTHAELVNLRDNNLLSPGMFYRITNYRCSIIGDTNSTGTAGYISAMHYFDIVLLALSENTLAERGWATHHEGDTYFANCNLAAWQVWYCLDNDTSRFDWCAPIIGSEDGVIYRLIDEWGNDCCYDFKNIVFEFEQGSNGEPLYTAGHSSVGTFGYVYTFNYCLLGDTTRNIDASVYQSSNSISGFCVCHNVISSPNYNNASANWGQILPRIGFFLGSNTANKTVCEGNKIDAFCEEGSSYSYLTFIAGLDVCHNIIMSGHKRVIIKNECHNNIIYPADPNSAASSDTGDIVLNQDCSYNVIGADCKWITLGNSCRYCKIDGCAYVTLQSGVALNNGFIQNVRVDNVKGVNSNPITINHMTANDNFITTYTSANNQTIVI